MTEVLSDNKKFKIEKISASEVKLWLQVPAVEFKKHIQEAAEELSKTLKIPGFRSGKIPFEVVERTLGAERLLYEGAEKAIKKVYVSVIIENKIDAIGEPKIDISKIAKGNDLEFTATVAIMPEIELGDWQKKAKEINANFTKEPVEIKEEQVQKELDFLAKQRAKVISVDRVAQMGDQVTVDFVVLKDGVPIEGGTAQKHPLVIGEGHFIPGFEENLIGLKADEEKTFELEFPKDYHAKHLAGQKTVFEVKLRTVEEKKLPQIDDEFASGIGKFKTLDELKKNIREGLQQEEKTKNLEKQKTDLITKIAQGINTDLPKILIDREVDRMLVELEQNIAMMGLVKQQYFEQVKTSEEKMREQWQEKEAPLRVKAALALREIAKIENIDVDSKEVQEKMNQTLQYYKTMGDMAKDVDLHKLYEMIKGNLINEKVFELLLSFK